jgi:hypothetical protein
MTVNTKEVPISFEATYREMAADELREPEALEWIEALVRNVAEEAP